MFKTDMNDREKQRLSAQAREVAKTAEALAIAIEGGDDSAIALNSIMYGIMSNGLGKELHDILSSGLQNGPTADFPDTIET